MIRDEHGIDWGAYGWLFGGAGLVLLFAWLMSNAEPTPERLMYNDQERYCITNGWTPPHY